MNSFPFIQNLFQTVLQQSLTIEGRFFVSYYNGREINSDIVGQLLTEVLTNTQQQKYPLAILLPPQLIGDVTDESSMAPFRITMLFLRETYYNGATNTIEWMNENTQTSTRAIINDWADMAKCAVMFMRVLDKVSRETPNSAYFQTLPGQTITPTSATGHDRVSGVRLDFEMSLFIGCDLEDYTDIEVLLNDIIFTYETPHTMPDTEIINFDTTQELITVQWNEDMRQRFGESPTISLFNLQPVQIGTNSQTGEPILLDQYIRNFNFPLSHDAEPPNQTQYLIINNTPYPGYVQIK